MINNDKYSNLVAKSPMIRDAFYLDLDKVKNWKDVIKDSKVTTLRIVKILASADVGLGALFKSIFDEDLFTYSTSDTPEIKNIRIFRMLVVTQIAEMVRVAVNSNTKYVKDIEVTGILKPTVKMYTKILRELQKVLEDAVDGKISDYGNFGDDTKCKMLMRRLVETHLAGSKVW